MLEEDGGVGEKRGASDFLHFSAWQNNAGLLQRGVGCHHACSGEEPGGRCWGEGSSLWAQQSRELYLEPQTRFRAWCWSPGSSLSLLCAVAYYLQGTNLGAQQHDRWSPKGCLTLAPRSWFLDAFLFLMTRSPFSLKTPVPSCFPSAVIKIV